MIVSFDAQLAILRIEGDEDRTTSGRRRRPFSAAIAATRDVIVDLSQVSHMDSTGLGVLVAFDRRLDGHGRLTIAAIQRAVLTIFEITGIGAKFDIFATVDEAIVHAHDTSEQVEV